MATSDQDGLDPTGAQTPEAFMQLLRQARTASGLSIVEIAEIARRRGYDLDPIDLAQAMESPALPTWQTVTGVLTACGLGGMQIDRWMRVYHDLAAPAQPVVPAAAVTAVQEPIDIEPISVPPLVLTTASAKPARFGPRRLAIGGGVLAALIMVPLLAYALLNGKPDTVAADSANTAPRTSDAVQPVPSPSDSPVVLPSPTEAAPTTTPAPVTTTAKPPTRTSPPPPPQSPSPPSPSPTTDPGVLRSGVLELTGNQGFDLDTGKADGDRDISRYNSDTLASPNGRRLEPMSGMPNKQACQGEQGWEFAVGGLQPGQWLCVRTSDGRYGRLNITATGSTLKLSYTVWT